ncbi:MULTISPECIES: RepB family plasmid replication initiator protein [unclassified Gilliamella]|uniref:RepB family plasmid replication initiator protein n=1 Tax=unclassified Gilliamella TaxID=2685620 RepID=UPI001325A862|nr:MULTISPECIES: RepB family plasmid replication initiator protein [unclassified Gilliamella]MWN32304.1 RepB family plasmid replication initiator protein [Gilliamella sp. Pra-s60]MWP29538.1 RepB family plasmid replication initiator protein [Gilliamella sp. Pra-s54]
MSDLIVYKSNDLVNASYNLTLAEQRIILFAISKLNPASADNKTVVIKASEFAKQFNKIDKNSIYKAIKDGLDDLYNKSIILKNEQKKITFRWLQAKAYLDNEATAELTFSDQIIPYLFDLKNKFTKYKLSNISTFKSVYSIRLYELLAQYKVIKARNIEVSELREILLLDDKYTRSFDFKKRVLEKAVNELNEKSDLSISYKISDDVIAFSIKSKKLEEDKELVAINSSSNKEYKSRSTAKYTKKQQKTNKSSSYMNNLKNGLFL